MIIAYRIRKIFRRVPVLTVLFAFLLIIVYLEMPFLRTAGITGGEVCNYLRMNNGINLTNLSVSAFYAENFYQLALYLWLMLTVFLFVEAHYGNLTFLLICLLFYGISIIIGLTPLYSTTLPFPLCQAYILMFSGFIVSTDTKVRADVFYMFFPVEHGYGKFDYPANVIFLPSYFIWQCIAIFFSVIFINRELMPTDGNAINLFLCPPIGMLTGMLFKNYYKKYSIEKKLFETGDGKADYNNLQLRGAEHFSSGEFKEALEIFLMEYEKTGNIELLHFIIESFKKLSIESDALKFIENAAGHLRMKNNEQGIYSLYRESTDAGYLLSLNPETLVIMARMLHKARLFEETREIIYFLYMNHQTNESVVNLKEYFDNIGFH